MDDQKCELGIDCEPGDPRPGHFFPKLLKGTGLAVADFDPPSKLFGAWSWTLKPSAEKRALFIAKRPVFERRILRWLDQKVIRGALIVPRLSELQVITGGAKKPAHGRSTQ
jgi:hypothetical protein